MLIRHQSCSNKYFVIILREKRGERFITENGSIIGAAQRRAFSKTNINKIGLLSDPSTKEYCDNLRSTERTREVFRRNQSRINLRITYLLFIWRSIPQWWRGCKFRVQVHIEPNASSEEVLTVRPFFRMIGRSWNRILLAKGFNLIYSGFRLILSHWFEVNFITLTEQ